MGTVYKHGIYGDVVKSSLPSASKSLGTIPAYIGTLPVQRANTSGAVDFDYSPYIGKPMLISSYKDVERLNLYSDNWDRYTLCEAIHAHFLNGSEVIAPIILLNVLEPTDFDTQTEIKTVILSSEGTSKVGYIEDPLASIDDMVITVSGATLSDGDFSYSYVGDSVKITINKGVTASTADVTYKRIAFSTEKVTADKMSNALKGLNMCEFLTGYIPNIVSAPHFSSIPELHAKMEQAAIDKIAEKWGFTITSDIPCGTDVNTIEKAKAWKVENEYNSVFDKVCYPKVKKGDKVYHLSTLATYTMQKTDMNNEDVPSITPSNKVINADAVVLDDGSSLFMIESEANELNKVGITTVNLIQRQLRLWGQHNANYDFEKLSSIHYEDRSDCYVRTTIYLANMLQYEYIDNVDIPFSRKDIDSIKTSVQQRLNALVNEGRLLYATVDFREEENSEEDLINGDFVFNVEYTLTPNSKSITFKLMYTPKGISLLTGGEE